MFRRAKRAGTIADYAFALELRAYFKRMPPLILITFFKRGY